MSTTDDLLERVGAQDTGSVSGMLNKLGLTGGVTGLSFWTVCCRACGREFTVGPGPPVLGAANRYPGKRAIMAAAAGDVIVAEHRGGLT